MEVKLPSSVAVLCALALTVLLCLRWKLSRTEERQALSVRIASIEGTLTSLFGNILSAAIAVCLAFYAIDVQKNQNDEKDLQQFVATSSSLIDSFSKKNTDLLLLRDRLLDVKRSCDDMNGRTTSRWRDHLVQINSMHNYLDGSAVGLKSFVDTNVNLLLTFGPAASKMLLQAIISLENNDLIVKDMQRSSSDLLRHLRERAVDTGQSLDQIANNDALKAYVCGLGAEVQSSIDEHVVEIGFNAFEMCIMRAAIRQGPARQQVIARTLGELDAALPEHVLSEYLDRFNDFKTPKGETCASYTHFDRARELGKEWREIVGANALQ